MFSLNQLDIRYVNQNGELRGDLEINENKMYLDHDKMSSLYTLQNDIILETQGKFIIKSPQSNRADSSIIKLYINEDKVHCNSTRVTDLLSPINNNNAYTKGYVDGPIAQTKTTLQRQITYLALVYKVKYWL